MKVSSRIKQLIPDRVKSSIKVLLGRATTHPFKANNQQNLWRLETGISKFHCPLCDSDLDGFNPISLYYFMNLDKYQHIHPYFQKETLNIIAYSCPNCGASDRERLYSMYFLKKMNSMSRNLRILDIAPAKPLQKFLKSKFSKMNYRSADLMMEGVDDHVDITEMNIYDDSSFDIFICSHVLEHIHDDEKAMKELYRILSPGGWGIAMVPISLNLKDDYENSEVKTEADRWKHFGQNDHVRMYSKSGFIKKLQRSGFKVNEFGIEYFGEKAFQINGIHPRSVLYIVEK